MQGDVYLAPKSILFYFLYILQLLVIVMEVYVANHDLRICAHVSNPTNPGLANTDTRTVDNETLASSPGNLLNPAAPCLVTQRLFFKMADGKACSSEVTAPPTLTVPTKRDEELTGDEANEHYFGFCLQYYLHGFLFLEEITVTAPI